MMRISPRRLLGAAASVILLGVALITFYAFSVGALGTSYFDDDGRTNGNCDVTNKDGTSLACGSSEIRVIVGETQYVQQTGSDLRAYFNNPWGRLVIENHNWCPGTAYGDDIETEDHPGAIGNGDNVTRIQVAGTVKYGKRYAANDGRCNNNLQFVLSNTDADPDNNLKNGNNPDIGLPGLWYVDISLDHADRVGGACQGNNHAGCDGTQNAMSVMLNSSNSANDDLIAPTGYLNSGRRTGTGVTVDADSGPTNYGIRVRFGTNCNINNERNEELVFFDLDGKDDGGAQKNGPVKFNLQRISPNGNVRWLHDGGPDDWRVNRPGFNSNSIKVAPTVPNARWEWTFKAHPDFKYELQVLNLYHNNTFQVTTPFDGVYAEHDCDRPSVNVDLSNRWAEVGSVRNTVDSLEAGEEAIFFARANNASTNKTGYLNDAHVRIWLDGGNRTFNGDGVNGDRVLRNNDDYINSPPLAIPPRGLPLNPGIGSNPEYKFTADANYSYLCGQLFGVDPTPPGPIETIVAVAERTCVPIGKYPGLTTRGGDVRAGGAVSSSLTVGCQLSQIPGFTSLEGLRIRAHLYRNIDGNRYKGSYAGLATLSPGEIREFGSLGLFYNGDGSPSSLGLFGTSSWDNSYHNEGYFLGEDADATTTTHCLPDLRTLYPAPVASTTIDSTNTPLVRSMTSATASRTYVFQGDNKTLRLTGGSLAAGQRVVIRVNQQNAAATNNTVIIYGDVAYPAGPYNAIAELPQLVIVADGNINIQFSGNMTTFSGLIATAGNLYTCDGHNGTVPITKDVCQGMPLTINGVTIVGNQLYPYRTSGFDTRANSSFAETFTLTPEFLLSDYARAQQQNKLRVDYQTGLPPRF